MNAFYPKLVIRLFVCSFLFFVYPNLPLYAQGEMPQSMIDTLLKPNKNKIKIVHVNGGWCRVCYQILPFVDYVAQNKLDKVEIILIFAYQISPKSGKKVGRNSLLNWLNQRGVFPSYHEVHARKLLEAGLHDAIPTTYIILQDGTLHRLVGADDKHKINLLAAIKKGVPKKIKAVDSIYEKKKKDLRKIILYDDKDYELRYSEKFTFQGNEGSYNTNIKVYEGDVMHILAQGKVRLGVLEGYTSPEGLSDGSFKTHSLIESINHGKLMAFLYDKNGKALEGVQVGTGVRFKATSTGELFLKINDRYFKNNQGYFEGTIMRFNLVKD